MKDFDIIWGMDWLETYYALLDCHHKKIVFRKLGEKEFIFQCPKTKFDKFLILALKASQMIEGVVKLFWQVL